MVLKEVNYYTIHNDKTQMVLKEVNLQMVLKEVTNADGLERN